MLHRRQREHVPPPAAVPVLCKRDRLGALDAAARRRHLRPRQHLQAAHREVPRVRLCLSCRSSLIVPLHCLLPLFIDRVFVYSLVISVFQCARSLAVSVNFGTRTFPSGAIFPDIGTAFRGSPPCWLSSLLGFVLVRSACFR